MSKQYIRITKKWIAVQIQIEVSLSQITQHVLFNFVVLGRPCATSPSFISTHPKNGFFSHEAIFYAFSFGHFRWRMLHDLNPAFHSARISVQSSVVVQLSHFFIWLHFCFIQYNRFQCVGSWLSAMHKLHQDHQLGLWSMPSLNILIDNGSGCVRKQNRQSK